MLFRPALLEGGAEERLSAGFGRRQPAAASLSVAGPVPESGASSQKWQAAGRQNAAFSQILGAGAFEAAGKPWPTGCRTDLPSGQPERAAPRDSRKGARSGQKLLPGQELPISIHAPREGSDIFLAALLFMYNNFYPRSPQGERRYLTSAVKWSCPISIHAPRKGSDAADRRRGDAVQNFYPRSPQGERQSGKQKETFTGRISIHAPRKGSDLCVSSRRTDLRDFYPRSPQGERPR